MPIVIADVQLSTWIVIGVVLAALAFTTRPARHADLLPVPLTQELKGLAILTIVFAHIAYMLVSDNTFLYPLTVAAGVGVDLFLFMSGFGLTIGMMRTRLSPLAFYRKRLSRVFTPFWVAIVLIFVADALVHQKYYAVGYVVQSLLGWFPRASAWEDVNSPFWYITWLLLFYALYPLVFMPRRPWLSALLLALIANALAQWNPLGMQANWLHRLHTNAFSLGMVAAWALQAYPGITRTVARLRDDRSRLVGPLIATGALGIALFLAPQGSAGKWPVLAPWLTSLGFEAGFTIGQGVSLATMAAVIVFFVLKRRDSRVLNIQGDYSYETYLLHWPLMGRYDIFYCWLPAWAATIAWLLAFIAAGWLLRQLVARVERLLGIA